MTSVASLIPARAAPINPRSVAIVAGLTVAAAVPFVGSDYWINSLIIPTLVMGLAGLGLNLLTGYAGLVSLGSAAFMAIGAFSAYNLLLRVPFLPLPVALVGAGLVAAAFGVLFGLPSLRIKGFYLSASTLGAQFFFEWLFTNFHWFSNDSLTLTISAPRLEIFGHDLNSPGGRYVLVAATTGLLYWLAHNIIDSRIGRDWMAIRDMETAAAVAGIPIGRRKLLAYGVSSFFCGIAGALWAFCYLGTTDAHAFDLDKSFQVLFIVIIGGSASLAGNFLGAAFIVLTPIALDLAVLGLRLDNVIDHGSVTNLLHIIFGVIIILLLIKEPDGLASLIGRLAKLLSPARLKRRAS
jgi:branched-chain amino acid transport system permease protein